MAKATLFNNLAVPDKLPIWTFGVEKIPHHLLPPAVATEYLTLVKEQSLTRLKFLADKCRDEGLYEQKVADQHMTSRESILDLEEDKR